MLADNYELWTVNLTDNCKILELVFAFQFYVQWK